VIDEISVEPAKRVTTFDHDGNENGWLLELFKDGEKTVAYLTAASPGAFCTACAPLATRASAAA
jgi:hypothetical protein